MSRRQAFVLAAALLARGAEAGVITLPPSLAAPGGFGAQTFLAPAAPASFALVLPASLSLIPVLSAAPAALAAAVIPAPAVERLAAPFGRVEVIRGFGSRILDNRRDVAVYLPPGYNESNASYPVLYIQDGQNVFDPATAFGGTDWGLAQTLDRLIASGEMARVIVIAPYNTPDRIDEFTPVADAVHGGGNGDAYGRFLSDELKPFVDARFRTRPGPEDTAVMGSSLGALISLHLAFTRPDVYSRAAALSPSLWWDEAWLTRYARGGPLPEHRPRLWIDMGTEEGDGADAHAGNIEGLRAFHAALYGRGWRDGAGLESREIEGASHNELAWRARAADVLKFLFPPAAR